MTKTEKLHRVRSIRAHLAGFTNRQEKTLREHIRAEWNRDRDPDYSAMNELLFAKHELNELVSDLRKEGYGQ
jgi:hypothetical protein